MNSCNFSLPFSGSPETLLNRAKFAAKRYGGIFDGDASAGIFQVDVFGEIVEGSYSISGQFLIIVIHSRPDSIPCRTIRAFLESQISE